MMRVFNSVLRNYVTYPWVTDDLKITITQIGKVNIIQPFYETRFDRLLEYKPRTWYKRGIWDSSNNIVISHDPAIHVGKEYHTMFKKGSQGIYEGYQNVPRYWDEKVTENFLHAYKTGEHFFDLMREEMITEKSISTYIPICNIIRLRELWLKVYDYMYMFDTGLCFFFKLLYNNKIISKQEKSLLENDLLSCRKNPKSVELYKMKELDSYEMYNGYYWKNELPRKKSRLEFIEIRLKELGHGDI